MRESGSITGSTETVFFKKETVVVLKGDLKREKKKGLVFKNILMEVITREIGTTI